MTAPEVEALFPLTPVQEGMLIESLASVEAGVHLEQMLWNLHGRLDVPQLAEALRRVIQLHPVLRTGFVWKDQEQPLQVVLASASPAFELEDWRALPPAVRAERLEACLQRDRRHGFRLSRPPLLRLKVIAVAAETWQIVWTHHHLLLDGWCLHQLFSQLLDIYEALGSGETLQAVPSPSYEQYVRWLGHQDVEAAAAFWRRSLAGLMGPTPLGLPAPAAVAAERERHGRLDAALPTAATSSLLALARRWRLTPNVLVQGSWALLLHAVSGWREVVFGTTCTHRPAELDDGDAMLGVFINTLPLRVGIAPAMTVGEWLADLQDQNLALQQYAYCGAGQVHAWSRLAAALPLYESLVVVENYPVRRRDLAACGLQVELPQAHYQGARTRHALALLVSLGPELRLQLVYDRRRFERVDGETFLAHLSALLAALPASVEGPLAEWLAVLSEERPVCRALPAPAGLAAGNAGDFPRTPIEEVVAEIWSQLLGVERIGIHDDFFAFGGHSLLATLLVARVSEAFEVDLPLQSLFAGPTVAGLASEIRRRKSGDGGVPAPLSDLPPVYPDPERRYEPFPLTDVQQAYWIGRRGDFELGNVATHCYLEVEVRGMELERLSAGWRRMIDRHDMLRAVFLADGRQQVLERVPDYRIELQDLRGQDAATQAYALEAVRARLGHQVLPANRWPLFEIRASQLADDRLLLHLSYDMLICDARSAQILSRELAATCADPAAPLPPLTLAFRDYVLAELAIRDSALYRRAMEYWQSRIASLPPAPELALARRPESLILPRFCRRSGGLARAEWNGLKRRAAQAGLTPSGVLLAAFAEVLTAWSRNPRYTVNVTLFNRLPLHPQVDQIVGDFTTLTLVAVDHTLAGPFAARARLLQEQLWERLEHRHVSGVRVLRELNRQHPGGGRVLMPVVFTSTLPLGRRGEESGPELGELVFMLGQTPQVWLDCQIAETGGALSVWWDAVDALFPAGMLDGMFAAYLDLLGRLAAAEEPWREPVPSLLPAAQLALHAALDVVVGSLPPARLLHDGFLAQVASPERAAVITPGKIVSYGELDRGSLRLAHRLRELGARPNTLVAVVMEKGWEQVAAVLGILRSGAAYLPIDPALPGERVRYLLRHGEVAVALTHPWLADQVEWPPETFVVPVVPAVLAAGEAGPPLAAAQGPDDLAYVIYTSGSTGLPKGVMIDHRGAWNTVEDVNARFGLGARDRVLGLSSLSFDLSVYDVFGTLAAGAALVLPAPAAARDPGNWLELARRERVSVWNSVPTLLEMLFEHGAGEPPLPALRLILLSGDWIPLPLAARARELYPDARLVSLGGATEASIWSIAFPIAEVDPAWTSIPYGKPLSHQSFHVLDEQLNPRPVWTTGHLYIGGVGLARGYWRDREKTAEAFVFHPHTGQRLYRTGDLGRLLPDGNIEFQGREDLQVKIRGHRIELAEVEAALASHPGVEMAAVAAAGLAGSRHLVGYVVPDRSSPAGLLLPVETAAVIDSAVWAAMLTAGRDGARRLPAIGLDADAIEVFRQRLNRMVAAYCAGALLRLGCFAFAGERRSVDELIDFYGVEPRFRRWLCRCLELLAELGLLAREGEIFVSRQALLAESPAPVLAELRRAVETGFRDADARAAALAGLALYERLGESLAELLSGVLQHVQVMFPGGSSELADDIYRLSFRRAYQVAQAVIAAWVSAHPADRPLRVLEIGAGVGSITGWLLPVLPAGRTVYAFTDISAYFTQLGAERFASHSGLRCSLLDIERDPVGQGFEPAAWDLVVAADVLHATARIAEAARHVHSLLAPGGVLLLVEHTRFEAPFNLAMGLAQGFDRFVDEDLRTLHPLLSTQQWRAVLARCGFDELSVVDEQATDAELTGVHLMLARAEAGRLEFQPEALRSFLRSQLPEYMIPSQLVALAALPLSANGKVARDRLPSQESAAPPQRSVQTAPRTPAEELVAGIWQQVLGSSAAVTPGDNFFELGGDSLLATRLASRLGRVFGVEPPLRLVFEAPTLAELSRRLTSLLELGAGVTAPPVLKLPYQDRGPLTFAQRRLWFLDRVHPGGSSFNIPGALRARGRLAFAALAQAADELVRRHEPLRTRFEDAGGSPMQVVVPPLAVPLPVIDLQSLPAAAAEEEARRLARFTAEQPFDLTRAPLLRLHLLRLQSDDHVLLFSLHHIIADAWSLGIVVRETAALYRAFLHAQPSPLGEPPLRYLDFAFWQHRWLGGEVLERLLAYWRQQLAHLHPVPLPTDWPRPAVYRYRGAVREAGLEVALVKGLQRLSRSEGATLFMVLLAAFKVLLHALSGKNDVAVATSIANRNREEIEGTIGDFVNLLVLRTDLGGNPTFRQLVERVREVTLAAYVHQDLPFEKLVEDLHPVRDLTAAMPLAQVLFVLENAPLEPLRLPDLTLTPFGPRHEVARYDLNVHVVPNGEELSLALLYNRDLFEAATAAALLDGYRELLPQVVAQPDTPVGELAGRLAGERRRKAVEALQRQRGTNQERLRRSPRRSAAAD